MAPDKKKQLEDLKLAIGTAAEEALMFLRACQGAGASPDECKVLTTSFLSALIHGPKKEDDKDG